MVVTSSQKIPDAAWENIISFLDTSDIPQISGASKKFYKLVPLDRYTQSIAFASIITGERTLSQLPVRIKGNIHFIERILMEKPLEFEELDLTTSTTPQLVRSFIVSNAIYRPKQIKFPENKEVELIENATSFALERAKNQQNTERLPSTVEIIQYGKEIHIFYNPVLIYNMVKASIHSIKNSEKKIPTKYVCDTIYKNFIEHTKRSGQYCHPIILSKLTELNDLHQKYFP